jgi:hypothetical protein
MHRGAHAAAASAALIVPLGNAVAVATAAPTVKKKVVVTTKTLTGVQGDAGRWGTVQVTIVVKKTTTTVGTKKTVARRITNVTVPVSPDHTSRSVFINRQALPLLIQETLQLLFNIKAYQLVSGATDSSYGFADSLQSALIAAKKV